MIMKLRISALVVASLLLVCCYSCSHKVKGFKVHPSGFSYKFIEMKPEGQIPKTGDILVLSLKIVNKDNKVFDESDYYRIQMSQPAFKGDFFTALALLQVGDSACFKLDALKFFEKNRKRDLPVEFKQGDPVFLYVRLKNIIDTKDLEVERENSYHTDAQQEKSLLRDYIRITNTTAKPTASGLYYIEQKAGTGKKAEIGKTLVVDYTGTTIDGKIFDSSLQKGRPISFVLGRGQVINGWEEGFQLMREGGKARLIIPSELAYGKDGLNNIILPYSTLVFDVELLEVK